MIRTRAVATPPAPDVRAIAEVASRIAGFTIEASAAALVIVQTDMAALCAKHAARIEWAIWDKETPINSVPAETILARGDYAGGEIYLIWIDGQLSVLQPHHPDVNAPVEADEAHEVAALHAAAIATDFAVGELIEGLVTSAVRPSPTVTLDELEGLLGTGNRRPRGL